MSFYDCFMSVLQCVTKEEKLTLRRVKLPFDYPVHYVVKSIRSKEILQYSMPHKSSYLTNELGMHFSYILFPEWWDLIQICMGSVCVHLLMLG